MSEGSQNLPDIQLALPLAKDKIAAFDFVLPGYRDIDLDHKGRLMSWKVARMCARPQPFMMKPHDVNNCTIGRKNDFFKDARVFAKSMKCEILPAFYDLTHINNLVLCKCRFVNLGKTSYQLYQEVWCTRSQQLLHKSIQKFVFVGVASRRPVHVPDILREECQLTDTTLEGDVTSRVEHLVEPDEGCLNVSCQVFDSDSDFNLHMSQSGFYRLCDNAVTEACHRGFFTRIRWDVVDRFRIIRIKASHLAEVNPGESVSVHIWEDATSALRIHAVMHKEDNKEAFHCTYEYCDVNDMNTTQ